MIPSYPNFKKLELNDREEYSDYVDNYEPFSDFNFVSLWTYNTKDEIEICYLNSNMVVKFTDYETLRPFYSYLGTNMVIDTANELLKLAKNQKLEEKLSLVPEASIWTTNDPETQNLLVTEDADNSDYILSIDSIAKMKGGAFAMHRNLINRFLKRVGDYRFESISFDDDFTCRQVDSLFMKWEKNKNSPEDNNNEREAIKRLMRDTRGENIKNYGIFADNTLIAFSTSELLSNATVMAHYRKADVDYPGIFQLLENQTCKKLSELGYEYMNYEQDLGIPGLRQAKKSWNPVRYLKKYTIKLKQ